MRCGTANESVSVMESYFVDNKSNVIQDTLLVVDSIKYTSLDKKAAVYILNSRCSSCLRQFVEFCQNMRGLSIPIIVIIYDHEDVMLKFMIEDYLKKRDLNIVILDNDNTYFKGSLSVHNGTVYAINNGEIRNKFKYNIDIF